MKKLYLLLLLPFMSAAYTGEEEAQLVVCGFIAQSLSGSETVSGDHSAKFLDEYASIQKARGVWTEKHKEEIYALARMTILKAQTQFKEMEPVNFRGDIIGELLEGSLDEPFFGWAYFGCESFRRKLDARAGD